MIEASAVGIVLRPPIRGQIPISRDCSAPRRKFRNFRAPIELLPGVLQDAFDWGERRRQKSFHGELGAFGEIVSNWLSRHLVGCEQPEAQGLAAIRVRPA